MALLDELANAAVEGRTVMTLGELSTVSGLAKSTTHRLLTGLSEHAMVARTEDGGYVLGPALVSYGRIAAEVLDTHHVLTEPSPLQQA